MARFDLYRSQGGELITTGDELSMALGVDFELHESGFIGGDYLMARTGATEVKVTPNYVDSEGYRLESGCATSDLLVYVSGDDSGVEQMVAALPASLELVDSKTL